MCITSFVSNRICVPPSEQKTLEIYPECGEWVDTGHTPTAVKTEDQIESYIASQPEAKQRDLRALHQLALDLAQGAKVWFLDGRDASGKIVSNPNIGYGSYSITYANGTTREFYQVGLSANTSGISVYVMGLEDKTYLAQTFGPTIGKASVSGYCIKFKALKDVDLEVLRAAMRCGFDAQS